MVWLLHSSREPQLGLASDAKYRADSKCCQPELPASPPPRQVRVSFASVGLPWDVPSVRVKGSLLIIPLSCLPPSPFRWEPQSTICTSPPASFSRDSDGVTCATALLGHLTACNPVPMTSSWHIFFPSFLPHLGATSFGELSVNPQVLVAAPYIPAAEASPHGLLSQPLACLLRKVSQARV